MPNTDYWAQAAPPWDAERRGQFCIICPFAANHYLQENGAWGSSAYYFQTKASALDCLRQALADDTLGDQMTGSEVTYSMSE
jgi:hypothetical protein